MRTRTAILAWTISLPIFTAEACISFAWLTRRHALGDVLQLFLDWRFLVGILLYWLIGIGCIVGINKVNAALHWGRKR